MMKKTLLVTTFGILGFAAKAQQDMAATHWIYNKMAVNPGHTGIDDGMCGSMLYRNQWDRIDGAPNSALFSFESPWRAFNDKEMPFGVGLNFIHDAIGFNRQNNLNLNFSYHLNVGPGVLGLGLGVGMVNFGLNPVWIPPTTTTDVTLPISSSVTNFDLNFGAYYKGNDWFAGISATHLPASALDINSGSTTAPATTPYNMARHYYIMGGKTFQSFLGNTNAALDVQAMGKTDLNKFTSDITARYIYRNLFYGGLGVRHTDGLSLLLGYKPIQKTLENGRGAWFLWAGYSYDINLFNKFSGFGRGTHEIAIKSCFIPVFPIAKSKHPRWL